MGKRLANLRIWGILEFGESYLILLKKRERENEEIKNCNIIDNFFFKWEEVRAESKKRKIKLKNIRKTKQRQKNQEIKENGLK